MVVDSNRSVPALLPRAECTVKLRTARCAALSLVLLASLASCSGTGDSASTPGAPPFSGTLGTAPSGGPGNGATGNPANSSVQSGAQGSQANGEQTAGNGTPLTGTANGTNGSAASANQGSGGSANANPMGTAAGGAAGSANSGTAGSASSGTAGSANSGTAGSASTVGSAGSTSNPAPPDVPAGDGSCNGALFCEDFEKYAVGALPTGAPWANETGGGGTLSIDGTNVRGTRSLHVRTADGGHGYIRVNNFSPPGNSFFGRVELLVNSFPTSPDYAHFVLVEATGAGGGLVRPVGGQYIPGQGATALWGVGNDQGSSGDWTSWQPTVPTVSAKWVCYEWEMRAADNNIDVWLDGVAQPALSVSSTTRRDYNGSKFAFPTFNTIWFGWYQFQASSTVRDIYLDDLALSTTRIGCAN
jgi:hypothetical protein